MRARLGRALARPLVITAALALGAALPAVAGGQEIDCDKPTDKEVRSLTFVGNTTFTADELSARVLTTPSSFTRRNFRFFGTRRCLPDPGGLDLDVRQLKQFYKDNGFYETKVDTAVTPDGENRVNVTFRIAEGPPMILDTLRINGLDSVPDRNAILHDLQLKPGGRFGRVLLIADVDSIRARLRNAGYPREEVLQNFTTNPRQRRAEVELNAVPGPRARFGTIAIERTGADPTTTGDIDSSVVLGLLGFRTGNWYSDRSLIDAQRNLYNLGTFRHVGIDLDTSRAGPDTLANVHVDVREDFMRQVTHEEGWATLDCFRVDGQYSDKNFLDKAWRLDLNGKLSKLGYGSPTASRVTRNLCYRPYLDQDSVGSSRVNYAVSASFRQPSIFSGHWTPAYTVYSERRSEYKAYLRTTYVGIDASATRNLGDQLPIRLGYTFELGQTNAEPVFLCAQFSRCDDREQTQVQGRLPFAVASVAYQIIRTDNLVDPRTGYRVSAELRGSSHYFGSDQSLTFVKVTGDEAVYKPLSSRVTIATRFRGGIIRGGRTQGSVLPPPQERLYAGGASSVRGFQQNELGPLVYLVDSTFDVKPLGVDPKTGDTLAALIAKSGSTARRTIPVGGNSLVVINFEVRVRDPFFPELLEYVPFVDAGQLNSESGSQVSSLNRVYVTPGFGVRYFSPVGPIQVNVGYNPSKARAGKAYWAPIRSSGKAPLICITAPGAEVAPVRLIGPLGQIDTNIDSSCPDSFVPAQGSSRFFKNIVLTFSLGTNF